MRPVHPSKWQENLSVNFLYVEKDISEQYNHVCHESKQIHEFPSSEQSTTKGRLGFGGGGGARVGMCEGMSSVPIILNLITVLQVLFQKYRLFTCAQKPESFKKKKSKY